MPYIKATHCKYCNLAFDGMGTPERANHSRWCEMNPKSKQYKEDLGTRATELHSGKKKPEHAQKIKKAYADGKYDHVNRSLNNVGRKHSLETKQLIKERALASPHRRLRRKLIEYNGVMLDSTWELALAKRLDELQVAWVRPEPIPWTDADGVMHNYFPDFYLPEHNLYIDPKNPLAAKVQQDKIEILTTLYPNLVILKTLSECKNFTV